MLTTATLMEYDDGSFMFLCFHDRNGELVPCFLISQIFYQLRFFSKLIKFSTSKANRNRFEIAKPLKLLQLFASQPSINWDHITARWITANQLIDRQTDRFPFRRSIGFAFWRMKTTRQVGTSYGRRRRHSHGYLERTSSSAS